MEGTLNSHAGAGPDSVPGVVLSCPLTGERRVRIRLCQSQNLTARKPIVSILTLEDHLHYFRPQR